MSVGYTILVLQAAMPPRSVPIYEEEGQRFEADDCRLLVEAAARNEIKWCALIHGHYPGRRLPPNELHGLKTVGYWDAEQPQSWGLPMHRNEGVEITWLESGALPFGAEDRQYMLRADALTVTCPWQPHQVGNPNLGAGRLHWIILDIGVRRPNQTWRWPPWIMLAEKDRNELANVLRHLGQPVWKATTEIRHCFLAIAHAVRSDRDGSEVSALTVRINELLLAMLELFRKQKPPLDESLTTSRRTVELFLNELGRSPGSLESEWTVRGMAAACGLGVTQFVHLVKQITNTTPFHYLNRCRLERAARLLDERAGQSVTEIAQACGFSSSQYFATVFGQRFGCSPTEFRRRQR